MLPLCLTLLLFWPAAAGQEEGGAGFTVQSEMDRRTGGVGEPFVLSVTVTHPPDLLWEPRSVSDRHGPFDIQQVTGPETAEAGPGSGSSTTHWTFRLTAFELGELEIPALELRYTRSDGPDVASVSTEAMTVTIASQVEDPNAEAADIRSGFELPPPGRLLAWVLGVAGVLAAAAVVWYWLRRRRARPEEPVEAPPLPAVPARPAYDRYSEALAALLAGRLVEAGRFKEFHIRLSEIVKGYLGEVFLFDAVDRTTLEVMGDLGRLARPTLRAEAGVFLQQCDMVKFAEHRPAGSECEAATERARKILDMGRPAGSPAPGSTAGRSVEGS